MSQQRSHVHNRLLDLLAEDDFKILAPHLEPVNLPKSYRIAAANQPITHYYFIESGLGSIVCSTADGFRAEVGMVGRDGIVPVAAMMECTSSVHEIVMQVEGHGYRIETAEFKRILASNSRIRTMMLRYVHILWIQTSYTALSNAVHHIEERLARWLLMCHDRMDDGRMHLTHEYLAVMLAVRRPSVTTALHILEGNHFIYSTRGLVTIRDREALENFAADAYGIPEREYNGLIGPMRAA